MNLIVKSLPKFFRSGAFITCAAAINSDGSSGSSTLQGAWDREAHVCSFASLDDPAMEISIFV